MEFADELTIQPFITEKTVCICRSTLFGLWPPPRIMTVVLQEHVSVTSLQVAPLVQGLGPPTQTPLEHLSFDVQKRPSSQGAVLLVYTGRPVAGSQESSVQGLLSLGTGSGVNTHPIAGLQ
jgi:hypothetical protein